MFERQVTLPFNLKRSLAVEAHMVFQWVYKPKIGLVGCTSLGVKISVAEERSKIVPILLRQVF